MKRIEGTLRNKKVLIVLDDVDNNEQMEKLVGKGHLCSGSRVLITTRNEDVLLSTGPKGHPRYNKDKEAEEVELSAAIQKLGNLEVLWIEDNLKGQLPSEIGLLGRLQKLVLRGCYEIPELLALPTSLTNLEMSFTSLQVVPDLSNLTNLVELDLADDFGIDERDRRIHTGDLRWIGRLSELEKLSLRLLHVPAPNELASLPKLNKLHLSGLDLQTFTQVPCSLFERTLEDCKSTALLSSNLNNLSDLYLINCQMQEIKFDGLQLPNLTVLCLNDCEPLEKFMLSSMRKLKEVVANDCPKLDEIHIAGVLESLEELRIDGCNSFGSVLLAHGVLLLFVRVSPFFFSVESSSHNYSMRPTTNVKSSSSEPDGMNEGGRECAGCIHRPIDGLACRGQRTRRNARGRECAAAFTGELMVLHAEGSAQEGMHVPGNVGDSWLHLRRHQGCKKTMKQASKQQPLQQAQQRWRQQRQPILQNRSGSLSFSSNMSLLREGEEVPSLALSTFRAKEEEIEREKMEVCILSHLGRIEGETERMTTIREKNGSGDDGGKDEAVEEQEIGGAEADEARHHVASSVWVKFLITDYGGMFPARGGVAITLSRFWGTSDRTQMSMCKLHLVTSRQFMDILDYT
ncbi:hypothetical protein NL676_023812 [Syzygium grande]|nr:hypothetical protein NL676_023812 [Syzygium grande]